MEYFLQQSDKVSSKSMGDDNKKTHINPTSEYSGDRGSIIQGESQQSNEDRQSNAVDDVL